MVVGALTIVVMLFFMVLPYFFQSEVGLTLYSGCPPRWQSPRSC